MADYVLTQEEIDSLLSSAERTGELDIGFRSKKAATAGQPPQATHALSAEQIASLQMRHERLARGLTVTLAPLLRGMVEIKVTGVSTVRYVEFTDGLDRPTCLNVLAVPPLEDKLLFEISPAIAFPMIDRMLGGGREKATIAKRPLTIIERRLMGRVTALFVKELQQAWHKTIRLEPAVERVETNPQLAQILPPQEPVVVVKFEVAVGESRGNMRLCLPLACLTTIAGTAPRDSAAHNDDRAGATTRRERSRTDGPSVELVAHLARTKIGAAEANSLAVGDILATDTHVADVLPMSIDGVTRFYGRPGAFQGHKAIQIELVADEAMSPSTDESPL